MTDALDKFNELREAQKLITNVRWWINHGKVETAEAAIAEYWRGWAERCLTRGELALKEKNRPITHREDWCSSTPDVESGDE